MRRDYTHLPSLGELKDILAKEAPREPVTDNYFADFQPITNLLNSFGLPVDFFSSNRGFESITDSDIDAVEELIRSLVSKIISSDKQSNKPLYDRIFDYLSEQDELRPADVIFVFGSASTFRIGKAIELYKSGFGKSIIISGRGPYYHQGEDTEAETLSQYAVEHGIPGSDIIKEDKSITLPDNVKSSLNKLDELSLNPKSIILVNSPFAQRRGWVHFKKFTNASVVRVNSDISPKYGRDHWFEQEDTIKVFVNEFVKMKLAVILNTA